jgi:hypothetical protein
MKDKQTAVEWFAERIQSDFIFNFENVLNQAKQMEKEQIGRAYQEGLIDGMSHSPKDYYNETYENGH